MTYSELQDALASLPNPHPLAETGVLSVAMVGTDVVFTVSQTQLEKDFAELQQVEQSLRDQLSNARARFDTLRFRVKELAEAEANVARLRMGVLS
jgi:hypothetical protein